MRQGFHPTHGRQLGPASRTGAAAFDTAFTELQTAGLAGSAGSDGYTLGMQRAGLAANISVAMLRRCEAVAAIDATARNAVARVMDAAVAEASSAVQGQTDVDDTVLVQRQIWAAAEESATLMSRVALLGRLPSEVGLYSC